MNYIELNLHAVCLSRRFRILLIYTIDHWIFFWANNLLNVHLRIHKMNVNRLQ